MANRKIIRARKQLKKLFMQHFDFAKVKSLDHLLIDFEQTLFVSDDYECEEILKCFDCNIFVLHDIFQEYLSERELFARENNLYFCPSVALGVVLVEKLRYAIDDYVFDHLQDQFESVYRSKRQFNTFYSRCIIPFFAELDLMQKS